jgi:MinD-like ATPase involved in chromosome partitioning or flagellar assembly
LTAEEGRVRTFLVLLEGDHGRAVAAALERMAPEQGAEVLVPAIRGLRFLSATGFEASELQAWWERASRGRGRPLVVIAHDDDLPRLLPELDADFVVAVQERRQLLRYRNLAGVRACATGDPIALAEAALGKQGANGAAAIPPPDPLRLLAAAGRLEAASPATELPARRSLSLGRFFDRLSQLRRPAVGEELGQTVLANKPVVAAVVSRKGGVGKTASAAAIAALLGEAVDPFGHTAALVDANIGNPDAWGRLQVRSHALTVREIVTRLARGEELPSPAYSETPALAVYPESREAGDGYAPAQVQRLAGYLTARHAAVVVDLPNRLPGFSSADAALAAAWIAEAKVVVLPTTADPAALLGVAEYQAAESVRGKPVVVPYIVPGLREIRTAHEVVTLLHRIQGSGAVIVEVPDDDRATLALIRRMAISDAGLALRQAYVALAARVVEAAARKEEAD